MHYDTPKWKNLITKRLKNDNTKSLREEIAILREVLSRILDQCDPASNDLMLMHGPITETILRIEKLVVSCHKLEISMKHLLDPTSLDAFMSQVIVILTKHLNPAQLVKVAGEVKQCKSTL